MHQDAHPMTQLSIGEAAALAGVHRTTILRQIKEGKLSASRDEKSSYRIDPAELQRVYPDLRVQCASDALSDAQQSNAALRTDAMQRAMQREIELLHQQIAALQRDKDALQQDKHWLMQQLESLQQRLLPPPKKPFLEKLAEAWGRLRKQ
jgi:excisionase family DNA binding protein